MLIPEAWSDQDRQAVNLPLQVVLGTCARGGVRPAEPLTAKGRNWGPQTPASVAPEGMAGFRPFRSSNPQVVTNEQVNAIRDQDGL